MNAQILQFKTTTTADRRIGPTMAEHARQAHDIMESAGYLVAAMYDPDHGVAIDSLSREVRSSLEALREELNAAGYLDAYKRDGGVLNV